MAFILLMFYKLLFVWMKLLNFYLKSVKEKKTVLFVGTKPQFGSIIEDCALKCNAHYVNKRWLGGMLTNWSTMEVCIENLKSLDKQEKEGIFDRLTKKEAIILRKKKKN